MTTYRYLFADTLTDQVLAELPLTGVSFSRELNTAGSFQGNMLLSDYREDVYALADNTVPGRTSVYVDRDGVLLWGGILWGRSYDSASQSIQFQAREFESYFEKRRILTSYSASVTEQFTVAETLVNQIQGLASGDLGITVVRNPTNSGVTVTKVYNGYEQKPLNEALYELSRAEDGFDWNIDVAYTSTGAITKTLNLNYPRRGRVWTPGSTTIPVLEFPGNIVEYKYPEEGGSIANVMLGVGAGNGETKLLSTQTDATQLANGWPRLEQSVSMTDYQIQSLLDEITLGKLEAQKNPVVVIDCVTEAWNDPVVGSFVQGDDVRLRITDARFPNTLDVTRRIAKYTVTPGESGPERITWSLVVTTN